ncbi:MULTISPECIES: hypothetical protein [Bacillus cereus group]|uniref:hypothetical protein n=1 Tax=Bacillus cereus group TaxID=86661 RepID=UPI000BF13BC1|nr:MULTISPECIES: hypothetical protein [Bacillus cereus group]PEK36075.1 hypothetical protein CN897_10500 [Bacillus toyonensis]PEL70761.1 hypothetical protein CN603_26920 [Bacillus toyonensis]TKI09293.1 hypothetical protein FC691_15700 [Bacillus cereus]
MSKGNPQLVTFTREDYSISTYIEDVCKEIAEHFKVKRKYLHQFCTLIRGSKAWTVENMEEKLSGWSEKVSHIPETKKFIQLINKAFKLCQNPEDIDHLRGGMVEALVIASRGGASILQSSHYGWGASVTINGETSHRIRYRCSELKAEGCANRLTVDFGHWNGYHGQFFECKVNPVSVGCKEEKYMIELDNCLSTKNISHEMFFVCAETHERVKMRLEEKNISEKFKPLGYDTLFA